MWLKNFWVLLQKLIINKYSGEQILLKTLTSENVKTFHNLLEHNIKRHYGDEDMNNSIVRNVKTWKYNVYWYIIFYVGPFIFY